MTVVRWLIATLLCSPLQRPVQFDGNWWRSVGIAERTGFLAGYLDCDISDAGDTQMRYVAWNVVEPKITEYYENRPSERNAPVALVLGKLAPPGLHAGTGGEAYPEKHGIFDGEYWRQSMPQHRLGFIEGYLECQRSAGKPVGRFSRSADWYVARISQWYGLKADDSADWNRTPEKIANVLQLLRDE